MHVVIVGGFGSVNGSIAGAMLSHGLKGLLAPRREA